MLLIMFLMLKQKKTNIEQNSNPKANHRPKLIFVLQLLINNNISLLNHQFTQYYYLQSNETIDDSKEIKYANNYAPNNLEKSYLNNPVAFMQSDSSLGITYLKKLNHVF